MIAVLTVKSGLDPHLISGLDGMVWNLVGNWILMLNCYRWGNLWCLLAYCKWLTCDTVLLQVG